MVRLKALVVAGDGRAEAKRLLRTPKNVNVKDILYSDRREVHFIALRRLNRTFNERLRI